MKQKHSLTEQLSPWITKPFRSVPRRLQKGINKDLRLTWDKLKPIVKRRYFSRIDFQQSFAKEKNNIFSNFVLLRIDEVRHQLLLAMSARASETVHAGDKQVRIYEKRLNSLYRINAIIPQTPSLNFELPKTNLIPNFGNDSSWMDYAEMLDYTQNRLHASPAEVNIWVLMEPDFDGVRAFVETQKKPYIKRFYFEHDMVEKPRSYISKCDFIRVEIEHFHPIDRYISFSELTALWPSTQYIVDLIEDRRLIDLHPIAGIATLETSMFSLSNVMTIQCEDRKFLPRSDLSLPIADKPPLNSKRTEARDFQLQQAAIRVAMDFKSEGKQPPSKRDIAIQLAKDDKWNMNPDRVERIIRRAW